LENISNEFGFDYELLGEWVPAPTMPVNCPPGLEYLTAIDQVLIHQKVGIIESLTGFETNNKYLVKNSMGQKIFYAVEGKIIRYEDIGS
jgi:hypothetical protein